MKSSIAGPLCAIILSGAASAAEVTRRGATLYLSGAIRFGDEHKLEQALSVAGLPKATTLYLDSPGGFIRPTRDMAREIRRAGLVTVVDGARASCASACVGLFAAGVRRHYVNAAAIRDGAGPARGLGMHESSAYDRAGRMNYSGGGTAEMIDIFYEMGASGAADLMKRAPYTGLFRLSGATALGVGLATSLSPP